MKKSVWIILVVGGFGVLFYYWFFQTQALSVSVTRVELGVVEATVSNTRAGTVKACRRSRLSMPTGGVVDQLLVTEGEEVTSGQLLLELWNLDHKANVNRALQSLSAAQHEAESTCVMALSKDREARRLSILSEKSLASSEDAENSADGAESQRRLCESAKNRQGAAGAQLELQRALLNRSQLRAPFAGIIAEINGEVGEYVTPSPPGVATPPAVDLIDYTCLYITAPIDEVDAGRVRVGLPAKVSLDAFRGRELSGEVVRIAPYVIDLAKQARTVDVEVQLGVLPNDINLLVGYSADVSVVLAHKKQVIRLPTESILAGNTVWVLSNDTGELTRRAIELGIGNWSFTEVISGLKAGEQVLRNPDNPGIAEGVIAVAADD